MAINKRYPVVRRGLFSTIIVRTENDGDSLDFLNFVETEEGIMYEDSSGYQLPLKFLLIESDSGNFGLESVIKNRLSEKMCKVLGETEKYYIVKGEH